MTEIEQFITDKGVRPTAMRLLVFRFLLKAKSAKTLSDIELEFFKVDRTTLYRTLKTFEDKSIVHKIDAGTGVTKYALCETNCNCEVERDLHLHFHCTSCKETICLTDRKIPSISLPEGYSATNINLVVKGICSICNKT